jgi:hypothetical protein
MLSSQSGSEAVLLPIESSRASPGEVGEGVWGKVSDESRYVPTAGPSAGWRYGCNLGVDADDLLDQKGRLAVRHYRMRPDEAAGMQGRGGLVARSRVPLRGREHPCRSGQDGGARSLQTAGLPDSVTSPVCRCESGSDGAALKKA